MSQQDEIVKLQAQIAGLQSALQKAEQDKADLQTKVDHYKSLTTTSLCTKLRQKKSIALINSNPPEPVTLERIIT